MKPETMKPQVSFSKKGHDPAFLGTLTGVCRVFGYLKPTWKCLNFMGFNFSFSLILNSVKSGSFLKSMSSWSHFLMAKGKKELTKKLLMNG